MYKVHVGGLVLLLDEFFIIALIEALNSAP